MRAVAASRTDDARRESQMSTFDERERQFEAKYSRDQDLQFKVQVRRNKLLGEWAADQIVLSGEARAAYAKEVVSADFEKPGDDDVLQKGHGDLTDSDAAIHDREER